MNSPSPESLEDPKNLRRQTAAFFFIARLGNTQTGFFFAVGRFSTTLGPWVHGDLEKSVK